MKLKVLLMSAVLLLVSPVTTYAETDVSVDNAIEEEVVNVVESVQIHEEPFEREITENVGVSPEMTRGLSKPPKDKKVNLTQATLSFAGYADRSTLFTNSNFTGKSKITYRIVNSGNKKLTVKIFSYTGFFATKSLTFNPNSTTTGTVSGLDKKELYHLRFYAPSDFEGYVK